MAVSESTGLSETTGLTEPTVLLGTVAIEPNRWGVLDSQKTATVQVSEWLDAIASAGFDGIELWENHVEGRDELEASAILLHHLPVPVFNSYASFDTDDSQHRDQAAKWATRLEGRAVKFNVGNDPGQELQYTDRISAWLDQLPPNGVALCECHFGSSIAEDPAVAARILEAAGRPERVQAIVHTHDEPDHLAACFAAYGERISHVHVNFLDFSVGQAPKLGDITERLRAQVETLKSLGFAGSWTIEFVHGIGTAADHPAALVDQAAEDLGVLRTVFR